MRLIGLLPVPDEWATGPRYVGAGAANFLAMRLLGVGRFVGGEFHPRAFQLDLEPVLLADDAVQVTAVDADSLLGVVAGFCVAAGLCVTGDETGTQALVLGF